MSNNLNGGGRGRNALSSVDFYRRVPKDLTEVRLCGFVVNCHVASVWSSVRHSTKFPYKHWGEIEKEIHPVIIGCYEKGTWQDATRRCLDITESFLSLTHTHTHTSFTCPFMS
jgi:hypothetical protein